MKFFFEFLKFDNFILLSFIGGGNLSNFQRKNFLTEDPEKMDLNLKIPSGLKIKGLTDMIETKSNSNEKKEETFKKMELQQQQTPSFFNNIKSFFL